MSMLTVSQPQPPAAAPDHPPAKVTGKVRAAIEAMVWLGLPRAKAAEHAAISEHGLYKALRKPPVRAYYLGLLEVLRTSERARNIHTLAEVRDQQTNQMARVQAVKALEQLEDSPTSSSARLQSPGFVIQVITQPAAPMRGMGDVEAKPLIEHASGRQVDEPDETAPPHQGDADR